MAKLIIEESIIHCNKCRSTTMHIRNAKSMTKAGLFGHLLMTVFTFGVWGLLVILDIIAIKITGGQKGKWHCKRCMGIV